MIFRKILATINGFFALRNIYHFFSAFISPSSFILSFSQRLPVSIVWSIFSATYFLTLVIFIGNVCFLLKPKNPGCVRILLGNINAFICLMMSIALILGYNKGVFTPTLLFQGVLYFSIYLLNAFFILKGYHEKTPVQFPEESK